MIKRRLRKFSGNHKINNQIGANEINIQGGIDESIQGLNDESGDDYKANLSFKKMFNELSDSHIDKDEDNYIKSES